jgi:pimeloyl-[acyl-carrier protein] methyl ester esterase
MNNPSLWCNTVGNLDSSKNIIFLHGWGFHSDVWLPLIPFFEKDYRITLLDLPGHGRSKNVAWPKNTDDLINQISPNIHKNSILVGWSLGGLLATLIAKKIPQNVKALVLIACNPCFVCRDDWADAMPESAFMQFEQALKADAEHLLQQFFGLVCKDDVHVRAINKQLKTHLFDYGKPSLAALQKSLAILRTVDLRNTLQQIALPVLHILGKRDTLVPIQIENYLRTLTSLSCVDVIDEASHIPFYSQPEGVANGIIHFIDRDFNGNK